MMESVKLSNKIEETKFSFSRDRGIVWVCDIENSSRYLNDNESVLAIEQYLPRLHWLGRIAISAAGGQFIKWTGDGFLGWFPFELHRDLGTRAARVLRAIWHLSFINNVTQLGLNTKEEHDALVTTVEDRDGSHDDLIGRSVVLAFRIAAIRAEFPNVITQSDIVKAISGEDIAKIHFRKLTLNANDRMRYFKGEKFGTDSLYESSERKYRKKSKETLLRTVRKQIARVEHPSSKLAPVDHTVQTIIDHLESGPEWTREVLANYMKFLRNDLFGALKEAETILNPSAAP